MITLIKDTIKPLYKYLLNKKEREFYRLFDGLRNYPRYKPVNDVKFFDYQFNITDALSFVWQVKEIFIDEVYRFKTDSTKPVIIDCGSNIGTSLLYFAKTYKNAEITGFEADPNIASLSTLNLIRNNIFDVEISNKAVWVNDGGVKFSIDGADGGNVISSTKTVEVASIRLKNLLIKMPTIDLLKIDIEGAEYDVMVDCSDSLENVKNIFIEYHSWNTNKQKLSEIINVLEKNNFRYYIEDITKRKLPFINQNRETNMDLQLNIFGYKN